MALAVLMVVMLCIPAFAAGPALTYDLTSGGSNAVTVEAGSDVTVTFTIEASGSYSLNSIQNVIPYDEDFLTLKSKSASVGEVAEVAYLSGNTVQFSDRVANYSATQVVGTITFTVNSGATGSTILSSTRTKANDSSGNAMSITTKDLTITVGTPTPAAVPVTSVTLSPKPVTLNVGATQQLSATVLPANASNKALTWVSGNVGIATVSDSGLVTAKAAGTTTITAIANDGSGKSDTVSVTVNPNTVAVTGVTLNKSTLSLAQGSSETLTATVAPSTATNKSVTWSSSNEGIATVSNGAVTAVAPGSAIITVTTADGGKTATCLVTVTSPVVTVTGVTLNKTDMGLVVGGSEGLIATVLPDHATNKNVTWKTSNASVATVSGGIVTAKAVGDATITVTTADGSKTATCAVHVSAQSVPAQSVALNKSSTSLPVGSSEALTATVSPANATGATLTWTSSNASVATVSGTGTIVAISEGTATITVRTENGKTATCTVTVTKESGDGGTVVPADPIVAAFASDGGTITPSGSQTVKPGSSITFRMKANDGCTLEAVFVDGKNVGAVSEYTFRNVREAHTIYASFHDPNGGSYKICPRNATCPIEPFTDTVNDAWWHDGIHYCVEHKLMQGISNTSFNPTGTTTRAMIVTILWRLEGEPVANYAMSFKDVPSGEWYTEAVRWAQSTGIVAGYSAEAFGPSDPITREQMATILYRYAKYHGINVANTNALNGYSDKAQVSSWALDAMKWANGAGLVQGRSVTTLVPGASITRAEAAAMIQRYCEKVK